jgi:HK97 family phage major capsid protein
VLNAELDRCDEQIRDIESRERNARAAETTMMSLRGNGPSLSDRELADQFRDRISQNSRAPVEVRADPRAVAETRATLTTPNMTPTSFYSAIVRHMIDSSAVLAAGATVLNTDSGEPLKVPKSSAYSSASIVSETSTIPTSDPTLGTVRWVRTSTGS